MQKRTYIFDLDDTLIPTHLHPEWKEGDYASLFFSETVEMAPAFCEWVELPHPSARVWYRAVFANPILIHLRTSSTQ